MTDEQEKKQYGYPPGYFPGPVYKEELNLRELFQVFWKGKWIIIVLTFVFAIGSVAYALSLPDIYRAQAKLAPAEDSEGSALSGMSSQFGGLASLAGVQIPRGQIDNATLALEILQSRQFIVNFIHRREILPDLMAVDRWSSSSGEVIYDEEIYAPETGTWFNPDNPNLEGKPTDWEAAKAFRELLRVNNDELTGFSTISIDHKSPVVAKNWVDWLISDINTEIRQKDIQEATSSREYLEEELSRISLSRMQQVFYHLIEKQTQTIMMANVRPEYVFTTIDPAVVAEEKAAPARALICIFGTMFGFFIGLVIVFLMYISRNQPDRS